MAGLLGLGGVDKFKQSDEDRTTKTSSTSTGKSSLSYLYPEEYGENYSVLSDYLKSRMGTGLKPYEGNIGLQEIAKTIQGGYDPNTSEYYQAYRTKAQSEMEDALKYLDETAAGANQYFTGGRDWARAKEAKGFAEDLAVKNAELAQVERQRQLDAAYNYLQTELGLDQNTANAVLSLLAGTKPLGTEGTTSETVEGKTIEPPASLLDYLSAISQGVGAYFGAK